MNLRSYQPLKNIRKRLPIWIFGTIVLLLIDEYVKEGYVFDIHDIVKPLTHENIIVILIAILIAITKLKKY